MKLNNLIAATLVVACSGCAQPRYIAEKPFLIISNLSGNKISTIDIKGCNDDIGAFQSIAQNLNSKQAIRYLVKLPCIDARAKDLDGNVIATQSRLVLPPKVRWTIY